jgi:TPR repeat protein
LVGMAAGLVGGYAASTGVANNWSERVRTLLAIGDVVPWQETRGMEQDGPTRSAVEGTIGAAHAIEPVAIEDNSRSDRNAVTQPDLAAEAPLRMDILAPEPGGHAEPWSNAGPDSVIIAPSTKDDSSVASIALARGDEAMRRRDIIAARRFYELAASAGSGDAATAVGKTYDDFYLRGMGVRGLRPDASKARQWYERGAQSGSSEAIVQLKRVLGTPEE